MYLNHKVNIHLICPSYGAHQYHWKNHGETIPNQETIFTAMGGKGKEAKLPMGSFDCDKEGPTLQSRHWLDVMCAEFQLIEIDNHAQALYSRTY